MSDDALERRNRGPNRRDLELGLSPAPDHAEAAHSRAGEILGRDAARGTRPQPPEEVGLDHRGEASVPEVEEQYRECDRSGGDRVRLEARVAELAVDGGHDGQVAVVDREPLPWAVLDRARR